MQLRFFGNRAARSIARRDESRDSVAAMSDTPDNEQPDNEQPKTESPQTESRGVLNVEMPEMRAPDGDATPPPAPAPEPEPETQEVASYADIQGEVNKRFAGSWVDFLRAVRNPVEILFFVFDGHFERDREKLEAWGKRQSIPEDWLPRFYSALSPEGDLIAPPEE